MKCESSVELMVVTNRQIVLHNLQKINELCFSVLLKGKLFVLVIMSKL